MQAWRRMFRGGVSILALGLAACGGSEEPAAAPDAGMSDAGSDAAAETGGALQGTMTCGDVPVATESCATCADDHCCDEGETCAANPACVSLRTCISKCPANDADCSEKCGDENEAGKADNAVLAACRMRWCSQPCFGSTGIECGFLLPPDSCNDCAQTNCCDVGYVSNTEPSFWAYQACVASCADAACFQDCDEAHGDGRHYYMAFIGCLGSHCVDVCGVPQAATCGGFYGDACAACVEKSCCDASFACLTDPLCLKLQSCRRACSDAACEKACDEGSPDSVDAYEAMQACLTGACAADCP